jgi:plasmid maintenance system antidote protein VapI
MDRIHLKKEVLEKYMKKNDLSEQDLATELDLDYTTVYRVLRGQRNVGPKFVAKVLTNTGFEFEDIFFTNDLPAGRKNNHSA